MSDDTSESVTLNDLLPTTPDLRAERLAGAAVEGAVGEPLADWVAREVLDAPRHVYTKALISAAPVPDPEKRGRVRVTVPAGDYPDGPLVEAAPAHWVAS